MATNEIWKDIYGYEGIYQVSNFGQVRRLCKNDNRIIKQEINRGYKRVCLSYKNVKKHFLVHRLVAFAFIPNPNNYPIINHKDENKLNNNVDNLEWCTHQYNLNYNGNRERCVKTRKENYVMTDETRKKLSLSHMGNTSHKGFKHSDETRLLISKKVREHNKNNPMTHMKKYYIMYDINTREQIMIFYTIKDIIDYLGLKCSPSTCATNISNCCRGVSKSAYGFYWKGVDR